MVSEEQVVGFVHCVLIVCFTRDVFECSKVLFSFFLNLVSDEEITCLIKHVYEPHLMFFPLSPIKKK